MKKICALIFALVLGVSAYCQNSVFSDTFICPGLGFPQMISKVGISKGNNKFGISAITAGCQVELVFNNRLALGADFQIGGAGTRNLEVGTTLGLHYSFDTSVGYEILDGVMLGDKPFYLILGGILGYGGQLFNYKSSNSSLIPSFCDIGADIFAAYQLTEKIGIFMDMKFIFYFGTFNTAAYTSPNILGFAFKPTLGVTIKML